jgi:hypothetical protein
VVALGTPAVNDNCGITLAATNNAPATFPVGTTSVTWTILDIYWQLEHGGAERRRGGRRRPDDLGSFERLDGCG